ncbi:MAG: DNA mismatch repair endonuclease MutL [Gammaproteobacteria bacterium]|jgi:DNA mismatch repair protein MutL
MTNHAEIRPLADRVIDQIAAGEVVERPASIVKELVENSLDAGAGRITIELDDGGIERILVRDDGEGIAPDQLPRAVLRHYTSKLTAAEELTAIASLGFRGEALASIASVTEFTITSRTADQAHGWQLRLVQGEAVAPPQPIPHPVGTTVEARRLFAAVPARRHFLKRPRTELLHIQQLVRRAGFCYPAVGFSLLHDGRQSLSLPPVGEPGVTSRRWRALFGAEFCQHWAIVEAASDALHASGWVGEPGFSRQNADLQYIAVNGRIVRDRNIAHAVRMAYASAIPDGRHAAYALQLDVPRDAVDVNVHPGKTEVRFRDVRAVHDFVFGAVRGAVSEAQAQAQKPQPYPVATAGSPPGVADPHTPSGQASGLRSSGPPMPGPLATNLAAIAHDRYALVEQSGQLSVLDLHAAIRKVVEHRLAAGECAVRPLIIPESTPGSPTDHELDALRRVGVDFQRFGEDRLALRGVPVVVSEVDQVVFARELLRHITLGTAPREAVAASAARAFRTPPAVAERRAWFATLERRLADLNIARTAFVAAPDAAYFARLFEPEGAPR